MHVGLKTLGYVQKVIDLNIGDILKLFDLITIHQEHAQRAGSFTIQWLKNNVPKVGIEKSVVESIYFIDEIIGEGIMKTFLEAWS